MARQKKDHLVKGLFVNALAETSNSGEQFVGILIALGILIIGGAWLIFPFIVISKINDVIRELRKITVAQTPGNNQPVTPKSAPQKPPSIPARINLD